MTKLKRYKRAYVSGTFDVLHVGHIRLFKFAKELAEEVIVSVNTDEFSERFKGKTYYNLKERMEIIAACKDVDAVIVNIGDEDSTIAILVAKADVIIHGNDWTGQSLMKQMGLTFKFLRDNDIRMIYHSPKYKYSSTRIKSILLAQSKVSPKCSSRRS